MKNLFTLLTVLFSLSFYTSCSNDPCDDIDCLNDGYCANGACVCPDGYDGADCSQEVVPRKITLTQIDVEGFPVMDFLRSKPWDSTGLPDLSIHIADDKVDSFYQYPYFIPEASLVEKHSIKLDVNFTDVNDEYVIFLIDDDTDVLISDNIYAKFDTIDGILFNPYLKGRGFANTVQFKSEEGTIFTLHLKYEW